MKKIAVGDLGEFWYGDYKEPFEQLEGGVPGHPVGVVLKADNGKLLCAYCGKTFDNLGLHAQQTHGMTARQYKDEVGLLQKSALVSERVRQVNIARELRRRANKTWPLEGHEPTGRTRRDGRAKSPANPAERLNKTGRCYAQVLAVARSLASKNRLTGSELRKHGIWEHVVRRYFGDIYALQRLVGAKSSIKRLTNTQLLTALRALAEEIGRTPTGSDLRRFGLPDANTFASHFGSYSEACRRAGLDPNLPVALDNELEIKVLVSYATLGSILRVAKHLGLGQDRVSDVLHRYGFPYPDVGGYGLVSLRRQWAADMARSLAGTAQEAA